MTYQLAQDILTALIQVVAVAGFAGVFLHHLWKNHCCWMAVHCPPVAPFQPEPEPQPMQSKKRTTAKSKKKLTK